MGICKNGFLGGVLVFIFSIVFGGISEAATVRPIAFPVLGNHSFKDDFGDPRSGGARSHLGVDIITDKMTPAVAAVDGVVVNVVSPQASWGYAISIQDAEGYQYRYLHLNNDTPGTDDGQGGEFYAYAPGIQRGALVRKGQIIGWIGDSGNAEAAGSHLHFEIRDPNRAAINPYQSLLMATVEFTTSTATGTVPTEGLPLDADEEVVVPIVQSRFIFTKDLEVGARGEEVRQLQMILKSLGYFKEDEITHYFGTKTKAALLAFQKANKIEALGIVGKKTRAVLNSENFVAAPKPSNVFRRDLELGMKGEDVKALQERLRELGFFTEEESTIYFGKITQTALVAFQKSKKISPAQGYFGPKTKAILSLE